MRSVPFQVLDHLESYHVTLAATETCREKSHDEIACERRPDDLRAEAEDVHVVVLDALVGRVHIVANRRADPRELGGRHRRTHTGAADEHPALRVSPQNRLADLPGLVR